jgi:hypothetical protein
MKTTKKGPDIEIVYDPVAEAFGEGLEIHASRHRVMAEGDFILWARRNYDRPTLFEYHHLETDQVVLCDWLIRGKVAQELTSYNGGCRPSRQFMDARVVLCRESAESMKRMLNKRAKERQRLRDETALQRMDQARHYRLKGMDDIAKGLQTCSTEYVGTEEGGEALAKTKEDLVALSRNRIITHG